MAHTYQLITARVGVWMEFYVGNYTDPRVGLGF